MKNWLTKWWDGIWDGGEFAYGGRWLSDEDEQPKIVDVEPVDPMPDARCRRLRLREHDALVISSPHAVSAEMWACLKIYLADWAPGHRVLLLDKGMGLTVVNVPPGKEVDPHPIGVAVDVPCSNRNPLGGFTPHGKPKGPPPTGGGTGIPRTDGREIFKL